MRGLAKGTENIVPTARVRIHAHTNGAAPSMVTLDETIFSVPFARPRYNKLFLNERTD